MGQERAALVCKRACSTSLLTLVDLHSHNTAGSWGGAGGGRDGGSISLTLPSCEGEASNPAANYRRRAEEEHASQCQPL